jgi:hypothetical protein
VYSKWQKWQDRIDKTKREKEEKERKSAKGAGDGNVQEGTTEMKRKCAVYDNKVKQGKKPCGIVK